MSRIGKKVIQIPDKTTVTFKDRVLTVKGEKGSLTRTVHPAVDVVMNDGSLNIVTISEDRNSRAFQGMERALVANMVTGVSKGFDRVLEINGIGYRAEVNGSSLTLNLGYSHPIDFAIPKDVNVKVDRNTITLSSIDKELLGHTASAIRRLRPPEPFKGKGIKYAEERIQRKAGKTGTK